MTITVILADGPKKRVIVERAFGHLGMAGYEFGRTPEEVATALGILNDLMWEWPLSGLSYVQPDYGVGNPDDQSGISPQHVNAVSGALAVPLAAEFGVTLSPEATARIVNSRRLLASQLATVPTMPFAGHTPRGSGSRTGFGPFIEESTPVVSGDYDPGDLAGLVD